MATPGNNTEVVRMLRDFKQAVSGTPFNFDPAFASGRRRSANVPGSVSTKLNFSQFKNSTVDVSNVSDVNSEDLLQSPEILKRKIVSQEVELKASRAALKEKEAEITVLEPANKKICIALEQQLQEMKRKNESDVNKIVQLGTRLRYAQNEASMAKSQALDMEKQKKVESDKLQMEVLACQHECSNMKYELAEVKSDKAEAVRKLNCEIGRLKLRVNAQEDEAKTSKEVIQSYKKQVQELTEKASKSITLHEQLCESQKVIKELEDKIAENEDSALIVQSMQSELKILSELRRENQLLKDELHKYKENNVSLFQEKMWSFQEKLTQAENKNVELTRLQVENDSLKTKMAEWQALCDDHGSSSVRSPATFSKRLSNYQKNEVLLTNKVSKLAAHCETIEKQNAALKSHTERLSKACEQANQNTHNQDPLLKRLKSRVVLLTKERDSCRQLIDSYMCEQTLSGSTVNNIHIKNLEDTIEEYKKSLLKSDVELEHLESRVMGLMEDIKLRDQIDNNVNQLQAENGLLHKKVKEMESKLLAQLNEDKPQQRERILHFCNNPLDDANRDHIEELKNLRDENDRLKKRIAVLQEEGSASDDVTAKVECKLRKEGSESTLQGLQERLSSAELKYKLVIETARSQSKEFREAVYHLTGYNVDRQSAGKYKISHVYADSADDFLLFEVNAQGVVLLETEYSSQLGEQMETYLHNFDSFPAFLASITMELFKQQTIMLPTRSINM